MNNDLLLLIKNHSDVLIEQTRSRPQETLQFKLNTQMGTFSFSTPLNLSEGRKWFLAITSFEATKSVFIITNKNKRFLFSTPGYWSLNSSEGTTNRIQKYVDLRSQNGIDLHVKKVKYRKPRIETENSGFNLAGFDHFKSELLAELKTLEYKDLDMVYRMVLS